MLDQVSNSLPFDLALCDPQAINRDYFAAYSGCGSWNNDSRILNISTWTLMEISANCSSRCTNASERTFLNLVRVPTSTLLFGAILMMLFSKYNISKRLVSVTRRTRDETPTHVSTGYHKTRKSTTNRNHKRIVNVLDAIVMIGTVLLDFFPAFRGKPRSKYVVDFALLGDPKRCIYGIPSIDQRIHDYATFYFLPVVLNLLHHSMILVDVIFVAHFVYWRSKLVNRILQENREVSKTMAWKEAMVPWMFSFIVFTAYFSANYQAFGVNEPKVGDICVPALTKRAWFAPFLLCSISTLWNIWKGSSTLRRLEKRKIGKGTVVTQTMFKRTSKDLLLLGFLTIATFLVFVPVSDFLTWDALFFTIKLVACIMWMLQNVISKSSRDKANRGMPGQTGFHVGSRYNAGPLKSTRSQDFSVRPSSSSVGGLSHLPNTSRIFPSSVY